MTKPEPAGGDPKGRIVGWDYVSLPVDELEEAVRFYRDILELDLLFVTPDRWAEFDLASLSLALYPREEGEPRGGEVAFSVGNLTDAVTRLEAKGVAFPHGIEEFHVPTRKGRLARFRDPSGNMLELVESS